MNLVIASFRSLEFEPLADITWPNKVKYALKFGHHRINGRHAPDVEVMWDRPKQWAAILESMPEGTWCLLLGCDTIFTRMDLDVVNWIDNDQDAMLLVDDFCVFGDCHLWKASPTTRAFMRSISEQSNRYAKDCDNEQKAFTSALTCGTVADYVNAVGRGEGTPEYYSRSQALHNKSGLKVKLLNGTKFCGDDGVNHGGLPAHYCWSKEHLILHLGGLSVAKRIELLPRYLP